MIVVDLCLSGIDNWLFRYYDYVSILFKSCTKKNKKKKMSDKEEGWNFGREVKEWLTKRSPECDEINNTKKKRIFEGFVTFI